MPALMLRSVRSGSLLVTALSLGTITSVAQADAGPCPPSLPLVAQNSAAPASSGTPSATGAQPQPTQPPPAQAQKVPKDAPVYLETDDATVGADGRVMLRGHVDVKQGEREIRADQVQYDKNTGDIQSQGSVDYTDPVLHATGDRGEYSPDGGATLKSAQFELRQRSARGSADSLQLTPTGVINLQGVQFTTCPKPHADWQLKAKSIELDTKNRVGTGRDAQVDFEGVPLMYLPWFSFPLGDQRKSGFLFPSVGTASRSGVLLAIPYYWNIAPNADFTFDPIFYTKRGADVGGELRLLTPGEHSEINWNFLPHDDVYGAQRSRIRFTNVSDLPDNFRFSVDATNVSDSQYFEDFSQSSELTSTAFVERRATLSYRDEHWRIDGEAQQYQTVDDTLLPTDRPYARVPSLSVSADYGFGPGDLLRYGFDSEVVNFQRNVGETGWRLDLMPAVSLNFDGPGYFVRPGIAWRGTQYQLSDAPPGAPTSPSRALPIASFDTGLVFERNPDAWGRQLTLEPRLLYLYVPYRNQNDLPVFDTAVPDLNLVELFRTNRYVGADRMSDANQVSVGVTSRLLDAHDGRQFLSATLGQTYYFETPRVRLPGEILPTHDTSDLVGQLTVSAFKNWNASFGLQWDPTTSLRQREEIDLQYRPSPEKVINLAYRFQRDLLEQAEISAAWPVSQHWNVFARGVYSLKDSEAIERFVGFEYSASCWKVRTLLRRFVSTRPPAGTTSTTGQQETGFFLQLELTGLASVGSAADTFLTESIRGYTRPAEPGLGKNPGL
jgi:LPS-assembly protein